MATIATATHNLTVPVIAMFVTVGFFTALTGVFYFGVPESPASHDAAMMLLGSLSTAWTSIVAYYFGRQRGDEEIDP